MVSSEILLQGQQYRVERVARPYPIIEDGAPVLINYEVINSEANTVEHRCSDLPSAMATLRNFEGMMNQILGDTDNEVLN